MLLKGWSNEKTHESFYSAQFKIHTCRDNLTGLFEKRWKPKMTNFFKKLAVNYRYDKFIWVIKKRKKLQNKNILFNKKSIY